MARICELPECHVSYVPNRPWQKCCSKEHGRKLRYLRRKMRLQADSGSAQVEKEYLESLNDRSN
jgi:hypothetical protein